MKTEARNKKTMNLEAMSTKTFLMVMNEEDHLVAPKVKEALESITVLVDQVIETLRAGGRLIYLGAGTSGRMGILDAVECVPTFNISKETLHGIMAGGMHALVEAVEGAEDSEEGGKADLMKLSLTSLDMVIGITASGRTPYVIGGINYANQIGAQTAAISCNSDSLISKKVQIAVEVELGPEVITGSTRLKAGTAQKMILNMISTASMVALGKTYGNLMVDVLPTNLKLEDRAKRIIVEATGVDYETAEVYYNASAKRPKVAIVMVLCSCSKVEAEERLRSGFVSKAIEGSV